MINQVSFDLMTANGPRHITITPINEPVRGGDFFSTGIYKLSAGVVGIGDIIFDLEMKKWVYNGIGELSYEQAAKVADFIKHYKDPPWADPNLLQ